MMKTIWKFDILTRDKFSVEMPEDAIILTVQDQRGAGVMWAVVDPESKKESREFKVIGTGHPVDDSTCVLKHIGTFQQADGALIWHLFEIL